jgi:hypothetical protein
MLSENPSSSKKEGGVSDSPLDLSKVVIGKSEIMQKKEGDEYDSIPDDNKPSEFQDDFEGISFGRQSFMHSRHSSKS